MNKNQNKSFFTKDKYVYMLTLTKPRIVILVGTSLIVAFLFFFLGFGVGVFSSKKDQPANSTDSVVLKKETPVKNGVATQEAADAAASAQEETDVEESAKGDVVVSDDNAPQDKSTPTSYTRVASSKRKINSTYFIQLVSSRDKARIDKHVADLVKRGYRVFLKKKGELYILSTGVYTSQKEAQKQLEILQTKGGFKGAYIKLGYVKK